MSGPHTIGRWLRDRARTTPDRVAIDYLERSCRPTGSSTPLGRVRDAFAGAGLRRGDRVATLTGNSPEHVALLLRVREGGPRSCSALVAAARPELAYQLDDAEPSLLLVEDEHEELAERCGRPLRRLEPGAGERGRGRPRSTSPTTTACCSSTRPGRRGSRRARCSRTRTASGRTSRSTSPPASAATTSSLQVLPQFHVGGWNVQALLAW